MNPTLLADALLAAVRAQDFGATPDTLRGGQAVAHFPSIDLAVALFPPDGGTPVWANVLFSREHPEGHVAQIGADASAVRGLRFDADQTDEKLVSVAWLPDSDWQRMAWQPLAGSGPTRFVAPYPASQIKLMVAVGVALTVDHGLADWHDDWRHGDRVRSVDAWCEDMIATSCNDSTSAMVALLHARGLIVRDGERETHNVLHELFNALGLPTLRLADTRPDGGWGNAAGAGVGHLQMTAWDTLRLLWLLDADAPPAPWLSAGAPSLLSVASRERIHGWLAAQGRHEILSSTALAGVPGWMPGLPAHLPARWIADDGSARVGEAAYPADVRSANARATLHFAHKTGTTENYASDAGIVRAIAPQRRHYLVALLTNLGTRYASDPHCATTWRIPALGAAIDAAIADWVE